MVSVRRACHMLDRNVYLVRQQTILSRIFGGRKKPCIPLFSVKPLGFIQFLGISMFVGSIALIPFTSCYTLMYSSTAPAGITTIILLLLSIGEMTLFSVGILGDYLGKVLEEVKSRPRFIRNRIFRGHEIIDISTQDGCFCGSAQGGLRVKDSIESLDTEDFMPIAVRESNCWRGWIELKIRQVIDFQVLNRIFKN